MAAAQQSPKPNPNRRRIPRQTIANTKPKFANNPPLPGRPFLQKQESHSHMSPIIPKSTDTLPFSSRPFLRRQESHSVVHVNNAKIHPQIPVPPQTIPAKAGISIKNRRQRRLKSAAHRESLKFHSAAVKLLMQANSRTNSHINCPFAAICPK